MQILWRLLRISQSRSWPRSTSTSRTCRWEWSVRVVERGDSVTIHQPAIRNASTGRRVRWLRVSHWWQEQTQADHVVLSSRVTHSSHWQPAEDIPCATWKRGRIFVLSWSVSYNYKRVWKRASSMNYTPREHSGDRKRLSLHNRVSLLSRETDNGEIAEIIEGDSLDAFPKVRHHAHVAGEFTTGKGEVRFFEAE